MEKRWEQATFKESARRAGRWVVAAVCVLSLGGAPAWADQKDDAPATPAVVLSATTAYIPLPAQFVCAKGFNLVSLSPDRKKVLVRHQIVKETRALENLLVEDAERERETLRRGGRVENELLVLDQESGQTKMVWRGGGSSAAGMTKIGLIRWLSGTPTALISVWNIPGPLPRVYLSEDPEDEGEETQSRTTTSVWLVNAETGKSRVIASGFGDYIWLVASRTHPVVVIVDTKNHTVQRIEANGQLGPVRTLQKPDGKKEHPFLTSFLADGRTLIGAIYEGDEDDDAHATYYEVDTLTGVVKEAGSTQLNVPENSKGGAAEMPLVVQQETKTLTRDGTTRTVHPLWLEGRDKETVGRVLIAADADTERKPQLLDSGVLYHHEGALYFVPILKADAAAFRARQHGAVESPKP